MEPQKEKEKVGKTMRAKIEKIPKAEKMEKEKTRVKNHVTSSQKRKMDVTRDNIVKDITEC